MDRDSHPSSDPDETLVPPDRTPPADGADEDPGATLILNPSEIPPPSLQAMVGGIPREIPVRLGKYSIDRELGRGAMGVVYLARQDDLQRQVALKLLLHGELSSEGQQRRFEREARAIARLRHPHIVSVHEIGMYQGQPFFTMDYIDGAPLDTFIQKNKIESTTVIADLCATIADAVQYAHDNGIVHRDLKPGNILVNRSGEPVITDFGLAKELDAGTVFSMAGDVMGTPAFMSPEQAEGHIERTGERSDVYSIGAILYSLLTGTPPFEGRTLVETLGHVIHDDPLPIGTANPAVEGELGAICHKAMEKDPILRYPSAAALAEDLRRFINGYPVEARPWTWRRSLRTFRRRHRRELNIAAVAAALLLLVGLASPRLFSRSTLDIADRYLQSDDPSVRADAVATLARELNQPDQLDPADRADALKLLLNRLNDPDPAVHGAVLAFVGDHTDDDHVLRGLDEAAIEAIQRTAGDDAHPHLRDQAIRALGGIRRPDIARHLVQRMQTEPNPAVRMKLIRAVGAQKSMRAIAPLMQISSHDPVCRAEADAAIERTLSERRLALFAAQDRQVRNALQGLNDAMAVHNRQLEDALALAESSPLPREQGPYDRYLEVLENGSEEDQILAVRELRRTGNRDVIPILVGLLGHDHSTVGAAAAMAIAELDDGSQTRALVDRLSAASPAVRRDAALTLGFTHDPAHVDPILVALSEEPSLLAAQDMVFALGELKSRAAVAGLERAARSDPRLESDVADALARIRTAAGK